jgi:uncharacterized protein YukE
VSELLGADTDVLDRNAESLSSDAQRVQDIATLAQRAVSELQGCWQGSDLTRLLEQWDQQTSPLLAAVGAALGTCAVQLRAQSTAQRVASEGGSAYQGGGNGGVLALTVSVTPPPPAGRDSPADNARWWRSLSLRQQQVVVSLHPDWIGNRDGVSFAARDQANRSLISVDRERLRTEGRHLEASLLGDWTGDFAHSEVTALDRVKDKLASLDAINTTLAGPGERQLLLLDVKPERAEAAVANGDVDTADNVAVFVPGLTANVTSSLAANHDKAGYDYKMSELRRRAELESTRAREKKTVAAVTWIGYQAPQLGFDLVGANSVASYHAATNGAAKLVPFLQGVNASRSRDAHLTLLGHSYGSTTAGLAMRQPTGVDDAVFFGSPGLGTDNANDLKVGRVNAGHLKYIEAQWDPVGDLGRFGTDPSLLAGVDHPSALQSTVTDPLTGKVRHFEGVTGHLDYLKDNSTSQYNLSVVVAELPDREVRSDGLDAGDVLGLAVRRALPDVPVP